MSKVYDAIHRYDVNSQVGFWKQEIYTRVASKGFNGSVDTIWNDINVLHKA